MGPGSKPRKAESISFWVDGHREVVGICGFNHHKHTVYMLLHIDVWMDLFCVSISTCISACIHLDPGNHTVQRDHIQIFLMSSE